MNVKSKLLAGAAALAVFGAAGAASALSVTSYTLGANVTARTGATLVAANAPFFATQVALTDDSVRADDRDNGQLYVVFTTEAALSAGSRLQINLSNAVFDGTLVPANVAAAGAVTIQQGGQDRQASVTFTLGAAETVGATIGVKIPFDVVAHAAVSFQSVTTDGAGVTVGLPVASQTVLQPVSMFTFRTAAIAGTATNQTADVAVTPAYSLFVNAAGITNSLRNAQVGALGLNVLTDVIVDLNTADAIVNNNVTPAENVGFAAQALISQATVTLGGDFSAFQGGTGLGAGAVTVGGNAFTVAAPPTTASRTYGIGTLTFIANNTAGPPAGAFNSVFAPVTGGDVILQTVTGGAIQESGYSASYSLVLPTPDFVTPVTGSSPLGTITRNGTAVVLPWTASQTQANTTGSVTAVRISNPTAGPYQQVFVRVLTSSTNPALRNQTFPIAAAANIASGSEVVLSAAQIEAAVGSNFGRGDIEIIVQGVNAIVRRTITTTGNVFEINNSRNTGTVFP